MFTPFIRGAREAFDSLTGTATGAAGAAAGGGRRRPNQQQHQNHHQHHHHEPKKTPPASTKAIRMLPQIRVSPEDLIDPNNRECCVCLESNNIDDRVVRLPCAHIFHAHCIVDWLGNHSCTCPVCRYELPTDNPEYEIGRTERMKTRRPRYALHELKRLPISQLLSLKNRTTTTGTNFSSSNGCIGMEKSELIQWLIDQERVDVIPAPEPVRYQLEMLRQMRVKELRQTMEDAGVFFRKEDVVEKEDMVSIFINSGRLELIPSPPPSPSTTTAEASSSSPPTSDDTELSPTSNTTGTTNVPPPPSSNVTRNEIQIETVTENDSDEDDDDSDVNGNDTGGISAKKEKRKRDESSSCKSSSTTATAAAADYDGTPEVMFPQWEETNDDNNNNNNEDMPPGAKVANNHAATGEAGNTHSHDTVEPTSNNPTEPNVDPTENQNDSDDMDIDDDDDDENPRSTFEHYSIPQLQALAEDCNIDVSNIVERQEIIQRLERVGLVGNDDNPDAMISIKFDSWTISQLRAVASVANIDVSDCHGREEIIHKILYEVNFVRPRLRALIRSFPPFHTYSIGHLKGIARSLNVDISDCLEKDEIIYRLITRGTNTQR